MTVLAPFDLGSPCLFAGFIGKTPCFAAADGLLHLPGWGRTVRAAEGGLTAVALSAGGSCLLTGGEDGTVRRFAAQSEHIGEPELLAETGGKWIDCLAAAPHSGDFAYSCGRRLYVGTENKHNRGKAAADKIYNIQEFKQERSVEGLSFGPRGLRLAVAHYNGATLFWPNTESEPVRLEWKGAHIGIIFSPDSRYIITSMQENALHGWRLEDCRHLRMSGYPAKVKSLSWSAKGRYLATSGAPAAIIWPFIGKDGPMGKAPLELGTRGDAMVSCVACHPQEEMAAIGYNDGMILFVRFADARERVLRRGGKGQITSMHWDKAGLRLAFGTEAGEAGLIDIEE